MLYLGYLASLIVLLSYLQKDPIRLRIIGSIGGVLFVLYGILKNDYPVIIVNLIIVLINLYFILFKNKK